MTWKPILASIWICGLLLWLGCLQAVASPSEQAAQSVNRFAFDFAHQLSFSPEDNIVFSPYSLSTALAMVREGAAGETRREIDQVLYFSPTDGENAANFASLVETFQTIDKSGTVRLEISNGIWVDQQFPITESFRNILQTSFQGKIAAADFLHQPEAERVTINQWVADKTENRIQNLLPTGFVQTSTKLILVNAAYFKGRWETPFQKFATQPQDFKLENGAIQSTPMMQITHSFAYSEDADVQCLEIPYQGRNLSMVVVLPKEISTGSKILDGLTLAKIDALLAARHEQSLRLTLPRWKITYSLLDILPKLQALGIHQAFSPATADFSNLTTPDLGHPLCISAAAQQAWLEVNEDGTEAAAATSIGMTAGAIMMAPPLQFRADHPFLFLIRENSSGTILFMGRLTNPG